jgi:Na+:H+ antiporter, NhaC family
VKHLNEQPTESKLPPLWKALLPVAFLVGTLWLAIVHFAEFELTTHVPLIFATVVASAVSITLGHTWNDIEEGIVKGISLALRACLILLVIGLLVGSWIQAGIVPSMIYYGLKLLSPSIFLVASCLICCVVSLATGSSWSTAATVGIALMGVGEGLGIPKPMIAGAIISGAYFGDKLSPLSDTTNLAPAMAGANLFEHIRHMLYTTVPSLLLALALYAILGRSHGGNLDTSQIDGILGALERGYTISPLLLLPPLLIIAMVVWKVPALPALMGGYGVGAVLAVVVQRQSFGQLLSVSYAGVKSGIGHPLVDDLLSRGGLSSMFSTVALIICALSFGGVMERSGMLAAIANGILRLARGTGGLVTATLCTCIGMNVLASDQYLAIVVPGRMFRAAYEKRGLAAINLSRALEDSGTLTSVLIPWNTCGAFMIATLGLEPWTYVPFCFLNLLNPFLSAIYGFTGVTMVKRLEPTKL